MAKTIKNPIKFNVSLNEEQKQAKELILGSEITLITGSGGTGKSLVCAQTALDLLFKGLYSKIYISRPTVEVGKTLGFLPGLLEDKYSPYIEAFIDNLRICYQNTDKLNKTLEEKTIDFYPLQFIRGKTIREGELLIVEEIQNSSRKEIEAICSRLGVGGKIILNGDLRQKDGSYDGLDFALDLARNVEGFKHINLTQNHRSGLVGDILNYIYK